MRSIYKYNITTAENGIIEGPITKLLTAQIQHGTIVVWAEVDTSKPNRKFQVIPLGTGWNLDPPSEAGCILDTHQYIGTVQVASGALVFHVYAAEILPVPSEKSDLEKSKDRQPAKSRINHDVLTHFIQ